MKFNMLVGGWSRFIRGPIYRPLQIFVNWRGRL